MTHPVEQYLAKRVTDANGEKHVYLHPGRLHFAAEPTVVSTILGSCVAVCLYEPTIGVGGMNHYLLPQMLSGEPTRFGETANAMLLELFDRAGIRRSLLEAKVFGGASVGGMREGDLGARNAEMAFESLSANGISVAGKDVGGTRGRKLVFRTDSGAAWVRLL